MQTPEAGRSSIRFIGVGIALLLLGSLAVAFLILRKPSDAGPQNAPAINADDIEFKAEHSDLESQTKLGMMYAKGLGVTQSYKDAANWYRRAAEQGHPPAQTAMGELFEAGRGVSRDEAEAARWYRQAAEKGYAPAQYNLAVLYAVGRGVALNATEAVTWYRRAAEQGDSLAQYNLGMRYFEGNGVGKDFVEAYQWLSLAASQKLADAENARGQLKKAMSREQIAEGKRRVSEFAPKIGTAPLH